MASLKIEVEEFEKTCRICLIQDDTLLSLSPDSLKLLNHIVDIQLSDCQLPNRMCTSCAEEFKNVKDFVQKCKDSYSILALALRQPREDVLENFTAMSDDDQKDFELLYSKQVLLGSDKLEVKKERYECTCCENVYSCEEALEDHLKHHSFSPSNFADTGNQEVVNTTDTELGGVNESGNRDAKLKCGHCKELFVSKHQLIEHLKSYSLLVYTCIACKRKFRNQQVFLYHINRYVNGNAYQCGTTKKANGKPAKRNKLRSSLYTKVVVNNKVQWKCTLCDRALTSYSALSSHMKTHTGETPYACEICGKKFSYRNSLTVHVRLHTGDTPYVCKICGKGYRSSSSLKKHMDVQHFIVDDSNREINENATVNIKDDVNDALDKIECNICKKKIHKNGFGTHRRIHIIEKKQFVCNYCSKQFQKSSHLERHIRIHTGERPFKCDICQKSFVQDGDLRRHRAQHAGKKEFQCQHCGKQYYTRSGLNSHVALHTGSKTAAYECTVCQKSFVQCTHYKRHLSSHAGEKSFLCTICGKGFTANASLKIHIMLHTGDTPHKCQVCEKGFTTTNNLKRHVSRHHTGEKPHICPICEKAFFDSSTLKRHVKTVHSVVDPKPEIVDYVMEGS